MGDKGGKKDRDKSNKQKQAKKQGQQKKPAGPRAQANLK
jgi:hypothetical protein